MLEGFPCYNLLAEFLNVALSVDRKESATKKLTPIIFCNSLFEYVLKTFTATSRPLCSPFHTSANPPLYNAT